ncbi:MAG: nucleoid occlusion protein, partial [Firmicutes bacterium]|nr:nucleoid occlusion protein [Bacillota bacterium]
ALLRLETPEAQRAALTQILEQGFNVAQTDAYIDSLLAPTADARPKPRRAFVLKDVRIFLNSLSKSLDIMKQGGIAAGMKKQETDTELIVTISIPKGK